LVCLEIQERTSTAGQSFSAEIGYSARGYLAVTAPNSLKLMVGRTGTNWALDSKGKIAAESACRMVNGRADRTAARREAHASVAG
jgi:hypothetical protein